MLLVYGFLNGRTKILRAAALYAKPVSVYVFWIPAVFMTHLLFKEFIPMLPGSDMPLIYFKGGDAVVHITGAVAFVVLLENILPRRIIGRKSMLWYMASVLSCLMLMVRAAYLSIFCGFMTIVFLYGVKKIKKPLAGAVIVITLLFITNPRITNPLSDYEISPGIAFGLARSIFIDSADPRFRQGTKIWRLMWWHDIAEETVFGPFFWSGRGFGENLADAHGYQVSSTNDPRPLRSPHNSHMAVLARMGVPGMFLWILLQGTLVCGFYRGWKRAGKRGDSFIQGVIGFVMCFWTVVMVNTSFDVFLEGPQGAIWFWSVAGLGLAASEIGAFPDSSQKTNITRIFTD